LHDPSNGNSLVATLLHGLIDPRVAAEL